MTTPPDPRSDWHEQDLLTKDEAGGRLNDERVETVAQLDALSVDDPERPGVTRRLNAIDEALRQLRAQ
jgi:hypothetical protein